MTIENAKKILYDIESVCKENNDDPLIVILNGDKLIPARKITVYCSAILNICTVIGNDDDSATLSDLMGILRNNNTAIDSIRINFDFHVKDIRIDMIDSFRTVIIEEDKR